MRSGLSTCLEPGCSTLVRGGGRCPTHGRIRRNALRTRSVMWSWVYKDPRWRVLRARVLREQPRCARVGCDKDATDVDHKVALQDGGAPFDRSNLHGLCHGHHSAKTLDEIRRRGE